MEDYERLKQEIVNVIASTKVGGLGTYSRMAERILKEVVWPHIDTVKAGYEEKFFKRKDDKDH